MFVARIAFIGIKDIRNSATIQIAFVFTTDGVNRIGTVLTGNGDEVGMNKADVHKNIENMTNEDIRKNLKLYDETPPKIFNESKNRSGMKFYKNPIKKGKHKGWMVL